MPLPILDLSDPRDRAAWSASLGRLRATASLSGEEGEVVARLVADLQSRFPFLNDFWALRLVRAYGTEALGILGDAKQATDLGQEFGATLTHAPGQHSRPMANT